MLGVPYFTFGSILRAFFVVCLCFAFLWLENRLLRRFQRNSTATATHGVLSFDGDVAWTQPKSVSCARVHTHTHAHTRTHTRTCTHTRMHTHAHTRTRTHTRTYTHARTHTHTDTHAHTRMHAHTHSHTRTHTHSLTRTRTCTCTHTHTHTHAHTRTHTHARTHTQARTHRHAHARTHTHTHTLTYALFLFFSGCLPVCPSLPSSQNTHVKTIHIISSVKTFSFKSLALCHKSKHPIQTSCQLLQPQACINTANSKTHFCKSWL